MKKLNKNNYQEINIIGVSASTPNPNVVYVPYILAEHTEESLSDYNKFMSEYRIKHEVCPNCGSHEHMSTLMGYIMHSDKRKEYKNLNRCTCMTCKNTHTTHDRVSIEEYKRNR